ncbi:MAG: anti-sigma F factor [Clostridia bacterium]|nr:anti-sigma F factor [Clostridia bacterium]
MKLTVPALSLNESFVRSTVAAFCVSSSPTLEEINDIKTAVSEAVTNSIVHAYGSEKGNIEIEAILLCDCVDIVIRDFGKGIANIDEAMQPFFTTRADDERSGMGFTVMQAFVDDVKVKSEVGVGTAVSLHKRFEEVKC